MTTRVTVKNEGPDLLMIRYYAEDRQFKAGHQVLAVGESCDITVWNGNLPVMWPLGHVEAATVTDEPKRLFTVPPATW